MSSGKAEAWVNGLLGKGEAGPVALGYSFGPGWPERQPAWHMVVVLVACSNGPLVLDQNGFTLGPNNRPQIGPWLGLGSIKMKAE